MPPQRPDLVLTSYVLQDTTKQDGQRQFAELAKKKTSKLTQTLNLTFL